MSSLLSFDSVTLRRGGRTLFQDLSLEVGPGDALQVAGPNGTGKSSLIRLAAGLLEAFKGRVRRSELALADHNIALDHELTLTRALQFWVTSPETAMETLGLGELAEAPVRLLSTGQLKRAVLARVVASGRPLWLLDEPLNGLDKDGVSTLTGVISRHLEAGGAVVAASHQPLPGTWRTLELAQ